MVKRVFNYFYYAFFKLKIYGVIKKFFLKLKIDEIKIIVYKKIKEEIFMLYISLAFILGVAVTIFVYETYFEKKGLKVEDLLSTKLAILLEESSKRIGERQKELNRKLTEEEKDKILDDCYNEYEYRA